MTFGETFRELRKLRRLPMTMWEPGIPSPYINDIEKKGLIPSEEKLRELAIVFVRVAREQKAADPEEDARLLWRERQRSYLTQRAKLDPAMVDLYISVHHVMGGLGRHDRGALVKAVNQAVAPFEGKAKPKVPWLKRIESPTSAKRTVGSKA